MEKVNASLWEALDHITYLLRMLPEYDFLEGKIERWVSEEAAREMVHVLLEVPDTFIPGVQISPLADGGLQAEWHWGKGLSFEIEVKSSGKRHIMVTKGSGNFFPESHIPLNCIFINYRGLP